MSTQNRSNLGYLPLIGIFALSVAAGVGIYYYFRGNLPFLSREGLTPLEAVEVVPESAFASSYVSTRPQDWKQLTQYGTVEAQQRIQNNLKQWEANTFSDLEISFEKDIQPWIDGVTFAILPNQQETDFSENFQVLIVIGIKNKLKAAQFARKLNQEPDVTLTERQYQDLKITDVTGINGDKFSFSLIENRLIVAQKSDLIEQAIDTFKTKNSYANEPGVKEMMSQSLSLKNSFLNVYVSDYEKIIDELLPNGSQNLPGVTLQQLKDLESVVIGMTAKKQGLHLQMVTQFAPDTVNSLPSPLAGNFLSKFPEQTMMFMNGQNIDKGWSTLVEQSTQDSYLEEIVEQIRQGFGRDKFDVDREIFGWLNGKFAIGMTTLERGGMANLGIAGMMILETSDRSRGENSLNKLNQWAQTEASLDTNQQKIGNMTVTEWRINQQGVILSHGWLDNQKLQVTLGTSWETIEQQKNKKSLQNNPKFSKIRSLLPSNNLGYFYLDLEQVINQITRFYGGAVDPQTETILNSFQGLGVTATSPNSATRQLDIVLSLKSIN